MRKTCLIFVINICLFLSLSVGNVFAQALDTVVDKEAMIKQYLDSVSKSIKYQKGKIGLQGIADLDITDQYKFIPAEASEMIVHDIWGNPPAKDILGMIVKSDFSLTAGGWAFIIRYEEDGFVKDDDADKINYDDLLKEIQKDEIENNKGRANTGYEPIHMLAWATKPYYDKEKKVLHWAKKLQFGDTTPVISLNYDVRVLGRKGILSLNAVGTMEDLDDINKHIPDVLKMATFTDGNKYKDFNPSIDKVAAYTIGGLIAGKLIAKTGLLILLLKNIKLILIACLGGFAAFRKRVAGWFTKKKKDDEYPVTETQQPMLAEADETKTEEVTTEQEPKSDDSTENKTAR